ncbi:MAG TPA: hypothetical protein VMF57_14410 [Solirubrobacteraceae bacterium]|nr:hypothetical protein [Solirubrobacteraceae bacterium]
MERSVGRRWVLSGVVAFAVLAGPVAAAQASDNDLRQTLNTYAPKIVKDENAVKKGLKEYPKGKSKPLVKALNHEVSDLHSLKKALTHESASSTKGRKGKKDIVKGLGLIATAYGALSRDVQAAHGGAVPASEVNAAVSTDKQGRTKLLAGLHLLSST